MWGYLSTSVASLAAAGKGTLLLSWLPRRGRATFCLNVSLFSEVKQQWRVSHGLVLRQTPTPCITDGFVLSQLESPKGDPTIS